MTVLHYLLPLYQRNVAFGLPFSAHMEAIELEHYISLTCLKVEAHP